MRFAVSYDLTKPIQNYERLWDELERLGGKRLLLSQWLVNPRRPLMSARGLRDHLITGGFIDKDDRLMVISLDNKTWSRHNTISKVNDTISF